MGSMDSYANDDRDDGIPMEAPPPPKVFAAHYPGITPAMVIAEIELAVQVFPRLETAVERAKEVWEEFKGYHRLARGRRPAFEQARAWQQDRDMVRIRGRQVTDYPDEHKPAVVALWRALEDAF